MSEVRERKTKQSTTEETLQKKMQGLRTKLAGDRDASNAFLQRAGILTPTGKLKKAYR